MFIKSIIQALLTYEMIRFLLPKYFCKELEGLMAHFLWQKCTDKKGIH